MTRRYSFVASREICRNEFGGWYVCLWLIELCHDGGLSGSRMIGELCGTEAIIPYVMIGDGYKPASGDV